MCETVSNPGESYPNFGDSMAFLRGPSTECQRSISERLQAEVLTRVNTHMCVFAFLGVVIGFGVGVTAIKTNTSSQGTFNPANDAD